jgi:hypothetical protein
MQPANIKKCRCRTTFHLSNLLVAVLFSVVVATLSLAAPSDLYTTFRNSDRTNNTPISSILNPDGLVKPGSSGSFDPKGFRMVTGVERPAICSRPWYAGRGGGGCSGPAL